MTRFGVGGIDPLSLIPAVVILGPLLALIVLFTIAVRRSTKRFGYPSAVAYPRAAPRSHAEKRDAADLALKGLVTCVLGLLFAPLALVGLLPLFYGGRKLAYASVAPDLADDPDQTGA